MRADVGKAPSSRERADGNAVGRLVGICDGLGDGSNEEDRLGDLDGFNEGDRVGGLVEVGLHVGAKVGDFDGG